MSVENVMTLEKKKGFTLIELMIVLAIIAILAVVLIPKSQIFKNNSKNAGVTTNVNTVRGYLESQVTNNGGIDSYLSDGDLKSKMASNFNLKVSGSSLTPNSATNTNEQIVNPFDKSKASVVIIGKSGSIDNKINMNSNEYKSHPGSVVIYVYSQGYAVFGVDNDGTATQILKVK
jgi:type IV pilus assembly protein PilA